MHPADIKAVLQKRNKSLARIAHELHLTPGTVSAVVSGKRRSRRVARHVSRITGLPIRVLWPAQYQDRRGEA